MSLTDQRRHMLALECERGPLGIVLVIGIRLASGLDNAREVTLQSGQPLPGRHPVGFQPVLLRQLPLLRHPPKLTSGFGAGDPCVFP